jgi:integrase/recombinase XerD
MNEFNNDNDNDNQLIKHTNNSSSAEQIKLDTNKCIQYMENIEGSYAFQCKDFCKFLRKNKLEFNVTSIKKYFIYLNNSDYAVNTKNIKRQAVKKVIRDIMQTAPEKERIEINRILEFLDKDPETKAYKINSKGVTKDKVLTEKEYKIFIKKIPNPTITMFVKFLWATGCRISEVLNIKLKNISIDKENAYITILGKGKKERRIFIKVELLKEIQDYFKGKVFLFEKSSNGEKYNRVYVSSEIKKYAKEILNRNNISAHKIRHSFATRMIEKTNKIQAVSQFLGHSDVAITLSTYTHQELTPEDMENEIR